MIRCRRWLLAIALLALPGACSVGDLTSDINRPSETTGVLEAPAPQPVLPTQTPIPSDTGWLLVSDGIETRELNVEHQGRSDRLLMARVDPDIVTFRVRYEPDRPRRVAGWLDEPDVRLMVNGGFYDPDNRALGLLIMDGVIFGRTYDGLGGLFGVSAGNIQIRSLILQPYQVGEQFEQMVQSFPMLLNAGGAINTLIRDNHQRAARTVVGIDRAGRMLFLVSPRSTFSLTDMAEWLAQSDLDLDAALNLDGGTSSGLIVRAADGVWGTDSWVSVPAVIEGRQE